MGRKTYQLMAGYGPTAQGDHSGVTEKMNRTPKLVFSSTLKRVDWQNWRLATGSVADEVARLKQVPGDGLLWVGGSDLEASFLEQGWVDEILQFGQLCLDIRACRPLALARHAPNPAR